MWMHIIILESNCGRRALEGAITEYRTALRLNPHEAHACFNLAIALHTKGDLVSARKEYKKTLKLIPRTSENEDRVKSIKSVLIQLAGAMR